MKFITDPYTPGKLQIQTSAGHVNWWEMRLDSDAAKQVFTEKDGHNTGWAHIGNWVAGNAEEAIKNGSAIMVDICFYLDQPNHEALSKSSQLFSSRHQASQWLNEQTLP